MVKNCLLQPFVNNSTVYCSPTFCGGNFWGLSNPANWVMPWGLSNSPPSFIWGAHPHALAVDSGFLAKFGFSSFWMEGLRPPFYGWWGSLFWWVGVFHVREAGWCHHSSWHGGTYPFHSPLLFGLANHDSLQGVVIYSWSSLSASINGP